MTLTTWSQVSISDGVQTCIPAMSSRELYSGSGQLLYTGPALALGLHAGFCVVRSQSSSGGALSPVITVQGAGGGER